MKIQSTKLEDKNQQSDQESATANTSVNAALFDQLFQFLTQTAISPDSINLADASIDANSTKDKMQSDTNKINDFSNLLDATVNNSNNTETDKRIDDISSLMLQISQNQAENPDHIADILDKKLAEYNQFKNENIEDLKNIGQKLPAKQINDKAVSKLLNNELNDNNTNQLSNKIEQEDRNIQNMLKQKTNTEIELNTSKIELNNVSANIKYGLQKNAKSIENKPNLSQIKDKQIILNSSTSDNNVITNIQTNHPYQPNLEMEIKAKNTNDDKLMDVFINLGQLINNHTLHRDNSSESELESINQMKMDSKAVESNHFDPLNDVKFEITTGNELHPEQLAQQAYDAKIKIYPPELGHVIAKLKVEKNNAELVILTENIQVKQIVESNLSLLKEHFQNSDINLVQIDVQTAQTGGESNKNQDDKQQYATDKQSKELNTPNQILKSPNKDKNAIIDTYA